MHDGTPHAHFLLFVSPEGSEQVQNIFRTYALQEEGDEPGAKERRFTVKVIDPKKETAIGYIAKYISKNIDGFGVDKDLYGHNAATSAERVAAWAATWGIRQFQQFGGPSVTVWRELRRMGPQDNPEFEKIRLAADAGQWNEFTLLMGGPTASRKDQPVKLSRLFSAEPGRYGEPKGEQVVGLEFNGITFLSLKQNWTIICNPVKNRFEIGSNQFQGDEHNCTQGQNQTESGSEPVMEFSKPILEPVLETLLNISESFGIKTKVGPEQLQVFSKSRAHSAASNLEFCQ